MLLCDLQKYNGSRILLSNPPLLITIHLMEFSIRLLLSSMPMSKPRGPPIRLLYWTIGWHKTQKIINQK